jgi:hypothetical protein
VDGCSRPIGPSKGRDCSSVHMRGRSWYRSRHWRIGGDAAGRCTRNGGEPNPDAPFAELDYPTLEFRRQGIESVDDHFDVILLMDVFEHVEDPFALVRSCAARADWMVPISPSMSTSCVWFGTASWRLVVSSDTSTASPLRRPQRFSAIVD